MIIKMKVKDLKLLLSKYDDEYEVVMASDKECNIISPLDEIDDYYYLSESSWCGELIDPVDVQRGEYDFVDDGSLTRAICLFPVN